MTIVKLTEVDAGCIISGHVGWRISGEVIKFAERHGFVLTDEDTEQTNDYLNGDCKDPEYVYFLCDDAEDWLNENCAPEGYSFGFYEGEFFLWDEASWRGIDDLGHWQ